MRAPQIRLGSDEAWLELSRTGEDWWRVSANWASRLTADFSAYIPAGEAVDFAERVLAHLASVPGDPFTVAVGPGRNNPLKLTGIPVGGGFAFAVMLTPNGDDDVCHLQMELDPIEHGDLSSLFRAFRASLI